MACNWVCCVQDEDLPHLAALTILRMAAAASETVPAAATLGGGSSSSGGGGSSSSGGDALGTEAVALAGRVHAAVDRFRRAAPTPNLTLQQLRHKVLRPACQLADALLDWWRRPEAQQEQQLEAAQAAAARSCAYLRCSNLAGGGGPAAGEGEGSQRCRCGRGDWKLSVGWLVRRVAGFCHIVAPQCQGGGFWDEGVATAGSLLNLQLFLLSIRCCPPYLPCSACRAVWYCGTACSHADWREGGHRRICKALGAARAAEKAARRQQAEGSQVQPAAG